jgi:hypothetical protein
MHAPRESLRDRYQDKLCGMDSTRTQVMPGLAFYSNLCHTLCGGVTPVSTLLICKSQASAGDFCTILWAHFPFLLFFTVVSRLSQSQSKALLHGEDAFAFARRIVQKSPME